MDDVCLALRVEILPSQRQEMEVSISFADRSHYSSINRLEIELADFSGGGPRSRHQDCSNKKNTAHTPKDY
jgi:hypothetical protein